MKKIILSKVDKIMKMVQERGKVSLGEIARELKVPYALAEEWAHILEERDDVILVYPPNPLAEPYLKLAKEKKIEKKRGWTFRLFKRKKEKKKGVKKKEKEKRRKTKTKKERKIKIVDRDSPLYHLYRRLVK